MIYPIPVIDLFAGPGGLGEGFSSLSDSDNIRKFQIHLSIEKEASAHETLQFRSFFRQFWPVSEVPEVYYEFLKSGNPHLEAFENNYIDGFQTEWYHAQAEAWHHELGTNMETVHDRINKALNGNKDWVLIGGPPCQAYSIAGRGRVNGINPEDHRVHLYKRYLEIIARHAPKVFVMENVRGLLSAKIDGASIFEQILRDLRHPHEALAGEPELHSLSNSYRIFSFVKLPQRDLYGNELEYQPTDYLIESENYGIPQKRHRVILLGVRQDISIDKLPQLRPEAAITVKDVIGGLPALRSGLSRVEDSADRWRTEIQEIFHNGFEPQIKAKCVKGALVWQKIRSAAQTIQQKQFHHGRGGEFVAGPPDEIIQPALQSWFADDRIEGVCNHFARSHMHTDLYRYLFSACYSDVNQDSPKLRHYPDDLLPAHKNARSSKFGDRFRTQLYQNPATTITSHISKDGHYYIHPDPTQCRSLTVREAARIQTFPDNYYFMGNRTEQYVQVGNAVPPLLAKKIAAIVAEIFDQQPENNGPQTATESENAMMHGPK